MGLLTKQEILAAADLSIEDVEVPEWGGVVRVRALSAAERDRFEDSLMTGRGKKRQFSMMNARAKLVALTVVDEQGKQIFNDQDVAALGAKSAAALSRVFDAAMRLAGLTEDDVEELTENLG